jgi:site-specific recombinase XerD
MNSAELRPSFPVLLRDFFAQHLIVQKRVSSHTVAAYRDTFRLLFAYAQKHLKKQPAELVLADLNPALLLGFLDSLEGERENSIRTRNARLAALKSFLRYAALRDVMSLPDLQPSLAIPVKRCDKPLLGFLSRDELDAVLAACNRATWSGERDYVLLSLAYRTGARVSELLGLKIEDVELARGTWVRILGKGRKLRQLPLWKDTAALLRSWLGRIGKGPGASVLPNRWGRPMTRSAVQKRLRALVKVATATHPSLVGRRISPHTLRHTTAMHMLQAGVKEDTLALFLGHANPATTHAYIEADLAMKEEALQKLQPSGVPPRRFRAHDRLLAFLDGLTKGGAQDSFIEAVDRSNSCTRKQPLGGGENIEARGPVTTMADPGP